MDEQVALGHQEALVQSHRYPGIPAVQDDLVPRQGEVVIVVMQPLCRAIVRAVVDDDELAGGDTRVDRLRQVRQGRL